MIKISRECALFFQRSIPIPRIGAVPEYVADFERYTKELDAAITDGQQNKSHNNPLCTCRVAACDGTDGITAWATDLSCPIHGNHKATSK